MEHAGPGIYDEDYLDYLYQVVKKAGEYGFYVFIDPHQDVWSRFSGGDGAPGWTLEAAGLDMTGFKATGAAIVHQTHGDPFPRMIWPTNAYKLAAATMFTLFFAGNDFAPLTKVDGIPIQDYLQEHYLSAIQRVAEKLMGLECVIGYDSLNEPQRGYVGVSDLRERYGALELGVFPTPWQSILLGSGYPQTVNILARGIFGTARKGRLSLNKERKSAWLKDRKCVWRQNGVWDIDSEGSPRLLIPGYFSQVNGHKVDFVQDYLFPFIRKYAKTVHSVVPGAMIFMESEVEQTSPIWSDARDMNIVYAPHWYDGTTLVFKRFTSWLGADLYDAKPVFGSKNIIKSYSNQLKKIKDHSKDRLGNVPVLIGEIGIPFDMKGKIAYRIGDFSHQVKAMDRSMRTLEDNLLNYTLWNYTANNTNARGDRWNDEDLSIYSRDQQINPRDINSGGRALEAVARPFPVATPGEPLNLFFDYRRSHFEYSFKGDSTIQAPAVFYLPLIHYSGGVEVKVSDGEFRFDLTGQKLEYFPGNLDIHTIKFSRK